MRSLFTKRIVTVVLIALIGIGALIFFILRNKTDELTPIPDKTLEDIVSGPKLIGVSVENRAINSYTFGEGANHLLFVGGIHGGYEWNSVLLAYQFIDYLKENPTVIPKNITVTVIPSLNPDGVFKVISKEGRFTAADIPSGVDETLGRFNAHGVDLNRNFDCKWKSESTWRSQVVSAGTSAFSEPEAVALRDFVLKETPDAVVFWHSQSNAVYASECENGILPKTLDVMNAYSNASGYPAVSSFDAYPITGDAEGWLASINIPAVTVELQTHQTVEWERNLAGIKALFTLYSK